MPNNKNGFLALLLVLCLGVLLSTLAFQTVFLGPERKIPLEGYDLVIRNGRVMDPETRRDSIGLNVGIKGKEIVAITRKPIKGVREIDADGRVVAPGFIDILSYDPNSYGVWFKIADGVTTNLAMHGAEGTSGNMPLWFDRYKKILRL